ncbi:unnamed protein product [Arabis nemorensis]|uniref:Uncharacterized protein n=1 Tax=Arabis nemorensis TaxID=586526 RepID=A0A565C0F0_9BRAS|nr:unnamed protein product [Arabis nemorensis]
MPQYISTLELYSDKLPIVSTTYASSETYFGINVNPLCKPQHVSYTFLPNLSYFEFIEVDVDGGTMDHVVDLVDVKLGRYYDPLVTDYSGLHRCRIGDVLQVTGFYNNTPQFRFVRRKNTVLSVYVEPTTEEELLKAIASATVVLESSGLMLTGFTCYADSLHCSRMFRSKDGSIGALEIRVVQQGTFDSLRDFFISKGSSISHYKPPICINSSEALKVLEDKVLARFFSDKSPSF